MHTCILVKEETPPQGLLCIMHRLREVLSRVTLVTYSQVVLTSGQASALYEVNNPPDVIKCETVVRMAGISLFLIKITAVNGQEDLVAQVARLRGSNIDPKLCEPGTLRRIVYDYVTDLHPDWQGSISLEGGLTYYLNFVHVPQDEKELAVCDKIFCKYLGNGS